MQRSSSRSIATASGSHRRRYSVRAKRAPHDIVHFTLGIGKPVRVQYTREEAIAWDPKGTASVNRLRAGIDANGKVIAYELISKGFSREAGFPRPVCFSPAAGFPVGFRLPVDGR